MTNKLGRGRLVTVAIALLLIMTSWWQVLRVNSGLVVRQLEREGVPMRFMVREDVPQAPGVLVAHGFSGSQQLMLGYGYVLAQAGYGVLLWDFGGHGANAGGLNSPGATLQDNVDAAYAVLTAQPEVDNTRVAILGHSMGSGAAMRAGIQDPQRYRAVIGVSPTNAEVTPERPLNLLLQAGAWEPRFVRNAETLLAQAGGDNDNFAAGLARSFVLIPNVEHITILFSRASHEGALRWLHQSLGGPADTAYRDGRMLWYGMHLLGWLVAGTAVLPLLPLLPRPAAARGKRTWIGLLLAPIIATGSLLLLNQFTGVRDFGGVIIGGALAFWFLVVGLVWLFVGFRLFRPTRKGLLAGFGLFAFFWLAFGALGQLVWLPWLLIPVRLLRWPIWALACLPWLLAAGLAQQGQSGWRRALWWLGQSILLSGGLAMVVFLLPELSFVFLILPVLPLVLAVMTVAGYSLNDGWAFGLGGALFFGWLLLTLFPLAA